MASDGVGLELVGQHRRARSVGAVELWEAFPVRVETVEITTASTTGERVQLGDDDGITNTTTASTVTTGTISTTAAGMAMDETHKGGERRGLGSSVVAWAVG